MQTSDDSDVRKVQQEIDEVFHMHMLFVVYLLLAVCISTCPVEVIYCELFCEHLCDRW